MRTSLVAIFVTFVASTFVTQTVEARKADPAKTATLKIPKKPPKGPKGALKFDVLSRVAEAKDLLNRQKAERGTYRLAVIKENGQDMRLVTWTLDKDASVKGFKVSRKSRNGVNSEFDVTYPPGYVVLAVQTELPARGKVVYVPYTEDIDVPVLRERGLKYLRDSITVARAGLAKVDSHAIPGKSVPEVVPEAVVSALILIEHIDPAVFLKANDAKRRDIINRVLVILGGNQRAAYRYAISGANARGLAQFTPPTYSSIVKMYPDARLMKGFEDGADNHANILRAQHCLIDADLAHLSAATREKLREDPLLLGSYLAAAYNAGAPKAKYAIEKYDSKGWVKHIPYETRDYVAKFRSVMDLWIAPQFARR
jgi:hypothetical protein